MAKLVLSILVIILLCELILFLLVNFLRLKIPWVITNKDEYPIFNKKKITTFLKKTHDIRLGWNWKPNTTHKEKIFNKTNKIYFGQLGERKSFKLLKRKKNFAAFGDSFVFCRYVNNNQTWQEQLTKFKKHKGLNFGVGNYGLDQIYLKYLNTKLPRNIKTVYIGFVPETLSRCLCSWKHYHEFNNIYGFKPKFSLYKKNLRLIENPIKNINSFKDIKVIIDYLKKNEFFYKEKFFKFQLGFPFIYKFFLNPFHNIKLLYFSILKISNINKNKIFEYIIKENCIKNDDYFLEKKNKLLIKKLMLKIKKVSKSRRQKVFFLIFPQKHDLSLDKKNYKKFFIMLSKEFKIIDFTKIFENDDINKIYLPDQYGGHLTPYGNKVVAESLIKKKFT
tara:strand:- start:1235 stop:2407 length:1173 start_codon:yes stop_codon:yes gene_type:complete